MSSRRHTAGRWEKRQVRVQPGLKVFRDQSRTYLETEIIQVSVCLYNSPLDRQESADYVVEDTLPP